MNQLRYAAPDRSVEAEPGSGTVYVAPMVPVPPSSTNPESVRSGRYAAEAEALRAEHVRMQRLREEEEARLAALKDEVRSLEAAREAEAAKARDAERRRAEQQETARAEEARLGAVESERLAGVRREVEEEARRLDAVRQQHEELRRLRAAEEARLAAINAEAEAVRAKAEADRQRLEASLRALEAAEHEARAAVSSKEEAAVGGLCAESSTALRVLEEQALREAARQQLECALAMVVEEEGLQRSQVAAFEAEDCEDIAGVAAETKMAVEAEERRQAAATLAALSQGMVEAEDVARLAVDAAEGSDRQVLQQQFLQQALAALQAQLRAQAALSPSAVPPPPFVATTPATVAREGSRPLDLSPVAEAAPEEVDDDDASFHLSPTPDDVAPGPARPFKLTAPVLPPELVDGSPASVANETFQLDDPATPPPADATATLVDATPPPHVPAPRELSLSEKARRVQEARRAEGRLATQERALGMQRDAAEATPDLPSPGEASSSPAGSPDAPPGSNTTAELPPSSDSCAHTQPDATPSVSPAPEAPEARSPPKPSTEEAPPAPQLPSPNTRRRSLAVVLTALQRDEVMRRRLIEGECMAETGMLRCDQQKELDAAVEATAARAAAEESVVVRAETDVPTPDDAPEDAEHFAVAEFVNNVQADVLRRRGSPEGEEESGEMDALAQLSASDGGLSTDELRRAREAVASMSTTEQTALLAAIHQSVNMRGLDGFPESPSPHISTADTEDTAPRSPTDETELAAQFRSAAGAPPDAQPAATTEDAKRFWAEVTSPKTQTPDAQASVQAAAQAVDQVPDDQAPAAGPVAAAPAEHGSTTEAPPPASAKGAEVAVAPPQIPEQESEGGQPPPARLVNPYSAAGLGLAVAGGSVEVDRMTSDLVHTAVADGLQQFLTTHRVPGPPQSP